MACNIWKLQSIRIEKPGVTKTRDHIGFEIISPFGRAKLEAGHQEQVEITILLVIQGVKGASSLSSPSRDALAVDYEKLISSIISDEIHPSCSPSSRYIPILINVKIRAKF